MLKTRRERRWPRGRLFLVVAVFFTLCLSLLWAVACESDTEGETSGSTTSTVEGQRKSGEVEAEVGEPVTVGNARVTVNALQETFQPVLPVQRISKQMPPAPEAGESFYQAYVRVENLAVDPVRVDATDFTCLVGTTVVAIEPTRSGPIARSLLKNTSLDLILTFKAEAGFMPELRYNPPWYQGSIRVTLPQESAAGGSDSTVEGTTEETAPSDETMPE